MIEKLLHSKKEAAQLLSVSTKTLDRLIARRELKPRRVGRRVLFHHSELVRFTQRDHLLENVKAVA